MQELKETERGEGLSYKGTHYIYFGSPYILRDNISSINSVEYFINV